jgi:hypothetical protein
LALVNPIKAVNNMGRLAFAGLFILFFIIGVLTTHWYFTVWNSGVFICDVEHKHCARAKLPLVEKQARQIAAIIKPLI